MRQNTGGLARLDTVGEGSTQVASKLCRSSGRDQHRDGDQTPIARRQLGPRPHISVEDVVGEDRQTGRDPWLEFSRRSESALLAVGGRSGLLGLDRLCRRALALVRAPQHPGILLLAPLFPPPPRPTPAAFGGCQGCP